MSHKIRIQHNKSLKNENHIADTAKSTPIKFGPLGLRIAGPTKTNLKALQDKWLKWLEETAKQVSRGDPVAAAMADKSIPNLSSIVVLAECDGKTLLLTGDARGDHIVEGLRTAKLFKNDSLHVDVLKVQHHGSDRNTTRQFFDQVTADTYVLSANGKYGNPDFITVKWIVESARDRHKPITLVATNETDTIKELQEKLKPSDYGYSLNILRPGHHSLEVVLSP
jgi:beta-lactamase superfamily II metal-dependent hydrolase